MKYRNFSQSLYILQNKLTKIIAKLNFFSIFWWGIKTGRNTNFIGKCHFYKYPGSSIIIQGNCRFRSKPFSNHIGINRPCMISTQTENANITIGNNCGFSGTVIGAFKNITLGNNINCGANTLITDSDWHLNDPRSGAPADVIIGDNVWLGEGVKVLKGVTIGKNSVIGAGSVVTNSIPENVIAAGNPCKIIKQISI
jgi:acetyltransferase-like isoleucine patch superfamily enzyme